MRLVMVIAAIATAIAGCKERAHPPSSTGSGARGSGSGSLPGAIWFVEQRDPMPHRLVRIEAGKRLEIVGDFTPGRAQLPDGRMIAVISATPVSGPEQLVAIGTDGTVTRFGPTADHVRDPLVGSGGTWVIASVSAGERFDLQRIEVASGQATALTDDGESAAPASLGGDAIVFASHAHGDAALLRTRATGGVPTALLSAHKWDYGPEPSPDRKTIAFTSTRGGATKVFLVNADGTHLRRLNSRPDADGDEQDPVWSPDGTRVAYTNVLRGAGQVLIHDVATGSETAVTPADAHDSKPTWSPDGQWLLVARSFSERSQLAGDLWAIPAAGGDPVQITQTPEIEFEPRWL